MNASTHSNGFTRRSRGIALLLVMIMMVVCSILTAGFLSSQGTGIGIARNEYDGEKARALAQSGIDLCRWMIINRSDWRTALTPGTWLNNYAIGDGSVTVTAASADGTGSFANDTTKAGIFTAVGSYDSRTFTLTATIGPTGGGTVFRGGNYTNGKIVMGTSNGSGNAFVDSYNSANGAYSLTHGSSAVFGDNYAGSGGGGLTVFASSDYNGTFIAAKSANLGNAVYATYGYNGPSSVSQASQVYVPGAVILPNTTGLAYIGAISISNGSPSKGPGTYDSILLNGSSFTAQINLNASGIYHVTGNVTVEGWFGVLNVNSGVNAVMIVDGNLSLSSGAKISGTGTLTMYVSGSVSIADEAVVNSGGSTSAFTLLGTSTNTSITLNSNTIFYGSIYAPSAAVNLSSQATVYGAITSNSLTMLNNAAFHHDLALNSKRIDNLIGGSAPAGTADYAVNIVGTSAVVTH